MTQNDHRYQLALTFSHHRVCRLSAAAFHFALGVLGVCTLLVSLKPDASLSPDHRRGELVFDDGFIFEVPTDFLIQPCGDAG